MTSREKFEAWWEVNYHNGNPPRFGWGYWRDGDGYQIDDDESELDCMWEAWQAAESSMAVQLANAESKCRELAAENAHARERHVFIRALAVSILEHSGGRMDWRGAMEDATELLQTVDSVYAKTPATDAFLAEVRAQGVEMMAAEADQLMNEFGDDSYKVMVTADLQRFANAFAAQLRKGAAL